MVSTSTGFSGLTPAQSELISHWHHCCHNGLLPTRECVDPGAIRAHLSDISIVETKADGQTQFRLAGSGLRQIFGREMRGRSLNELDQSMFEVWSLGLARALDDQLPIGGLIHRDHETHAWLRLPLRGGREGALVLCHDALIPNARLQQKPPFGSYEISGHGRHLAA